MKIRNILSSLSKFAGQFALMIGVIAVSVMVMRSLIESKPEARKRPVFTTVFTVEAAKVELNDHQPTFSSFGNVTAGRDVELRALSAGEIIAVSDKLQAGQRVQKGDILVTIDPFEYEGALAEANANLLEVKARLVERKARLDGASAQIDNTQQQLQIAKADLERAESLRESGALTQKDVENRRSVLNERELSLTQRLNNIQIEKAGVTQLEAQIERLNWRVEQAKRNLQNTSLQAPFSGIISSARAEIGRNASASDILVSIYDDNALEARFSLTDAQFGRLSASKDGLIGKPITAIWNVGGKDFSFKGEISRAGAQILSDRGGVELFAKLDTHAAQISLRPGAFVEIVVPDRTFENSARLPEGVLYSSQNVYAIVEGQLEKREIEIHAYVEDDVIISGDLKQGEQVLTTRLAQIAQGTRVKLAGEEESGEDSEQASKNTSQDKRKTDGPNPDRRERLQKALKAEGLTMAQFRELPDEKRRQIMQKHSSQGAEK